MQNLTSHVAKNRHGYGELTKNITINIISLKVLIQFYKLQKKSTLFSYAHEVFTIVCYILTQKENCLAFLKVKILQGHSLTKYNTNINQ